MSVEVRLDRANRVYRPGETVKAVLELHSLGQQLVYDSISVQAEGVVNLQLSNKSVGLFDAFYSSSKPITLLTWSKDLAAAGKVAEGVMELPFEFVVAATQGNTLFETYHGVFVNIQYFILAEVKRGMLSKNLKRQLEFVLEAPEAERVLRPQPSPFTIVPESLENVKKTALHRVPNFKFVGRIDSVLCNIALPLMGEVTVEECSAEIKSIELQLVRIETCNYSDGSAREATEIQNIQVADGSVCRGWPIPIYMVFPRLFTCPSVSAQLFKIEFELNLAILFTDGHLLTEKFPLKLVRVGTAEALSYH